MDSKYWEVLAEKLMDVANFGVGALLIGQIIAKEFRLDWTLWGFGIWFILYLAAFLLYYLKPKQGG